ncbi:MAG: META domain-containing protein [Patescibacteria group bacterium]
MTTNHKNALVTIIVILAGLAFALLFKPTKIEAPIQQPENITMSGIYTFCIPRNDNFSPTECVEGLKLEDGSYYPMDFMLMSQTKPILKNDEKITVQGVVANGKLSVTNIVDTSTKPVGGKCFVGGCSGQVCSDQEGIASTCEFRPEYQCYKDTNAKCERQSTGKCGWTPSEKLYMCLDSAGFEGEANPAMMKLDMHTWTWIRALYNDGKEILPKNTKAFTLTFKKDNTFSATTDCNSVDGKYTVKGNVITFSNIFSTEMYCGGSQEAEFTKLLQNTTSYMFTSKGELILDLKFDSGTVIFR